MEAQESGRHKFNDDAGMTYQEVFDFSFRWLFIPLMQDLANQVGEDRLIGMVKQANEQIRVQGEESAASPAQSHDLATFTAWAREPNPFWGHTLTFEVVED